jgi:hypothetical protein
LGTGSSGTGSPGTGSSGAGSSAGSTPSGAGQGGFDLTKPATVSLNSVLDLIGAKVQVQAAGSGQNAQPTTLSSPFPNDPAQMLTYLPTLMEMTTVNSQAKIPGRINVNQAPRVLLEGIPGMTPEIVDQIIATRPQDPSELDPEFQYETWMLAKGVVTLEQMKALIPFVNAGGDVYRVESVGYFDEGGTAARVEALIDATAQPARVVFWRDISHLGRGYSPEILGAAP